MTGILIGTVLFTAVACGNNSVSQTEQSIQSTTANREGTKKAGLMDIIDYTSILMVNYDSEGSLLSAQLKKYYRKGVVKELYSVVSGEKLEDLYTKNPEVTYSEPDEQTRISVDNANYERITYDSNWNIIKYESGANVITYSYDQNNNCIRREFKIASSTTSQSNITTEYSYDDNKLCISNTTNTVVKEGENTKESTSKYDSKYEFDSNGYPTRIINYKDGKEESYEIYTRNAEHQIIQRDIYRSGKLAVTEKYE